MPYKIQGEGQKNLNLKQGRIPYLGDGADFWPAYGNTAGVGTSAKQIIAQREPFEFRPGSTALSGGMVAAGTRTGAATVTSGTVGSSTYYGGWITYQPVRAGSIDGLATGGVVWGQATIGIKTGAGTGTAKLTLDIANTANTSAPTTALALTGTITITTTEIFQTYDINYLKTDSAFNAVPFSVRLGVQGQQGGSTVVGRIMESSVILGEFEPL